MLQLHNMITLLGKRIYQYYAYHTDIGKLTIEVNLEIYPLSWYQMKTICKT